MPQNSPSPRPQRWRAVSNMTIEGKRGEPDRQLKAGEECADTPDNWPPKWAIEQGLVEPIDDADDTEKPASPVAGSDEKGAR